MEPSVDLFAAALRLAARCFVGEPKAKVFAQKLPFEQQGMPIGSWIVTVEDGPTHRTYQVVEGREDLGLLELTGWRDTYCAECGDELGAGARVEDTRFASDRGTGGSVYLAGCASCIAYRVRKIEEAA
jgi:hypothetical protein